MCQNSNRFRFRSTSAWCGRDSGSVESCLSPPSEGVSSTEKSPRALDILHVWARAFQDKSILQHSRDNDIC